jgi:DNA-binding transcriptional ArsR family regulator
VGQLAAGLPVSRSAVSQHLKVLKDAGLVAVRPHGQRRLYVARPEGLAALRDFLAEFWPEHLQHLKHVMETADDR